MKKKITGLTAFLLSVVMCISFVCPGFAAALPDGVERVDIAEAFPKAERLADSLLSQNEMTADLGATIYGALFADSTLNSLFCGIYSALAENESTFSGIGLDISVAAVAAQLESYPEVYEYLSSKQSWDEALPGMNCKWGITSKDGFSHAAAGILAPLNALLYTLLCGGRYKVNALIYIDGDMGYLNAIVPVLQAAGCPSIMSNDAFCAAAKENHYSMIKNILSMLYSCIDAIIASPVSKLCEVLPCIAYFIKNDGVSNAVNTLVSPMQVQVGLFKLSGLDKILESTGMLSNAADLTDMLENVDIGALTGTELDLELPELDLDALAACCTYANGSYTSDREAALCEILRWALKLFRANKTALLSGMGDMPAEAAGFIDGLLSRSDDELLKLLFDILNLDSDDTVLEYAWSYPAYTPGTVAYTPNLTEAEYKKVLSEIDGTLNEFLSEFGDGSLTSTLSTAIYSNKLVTTLVKTLYGALYSEETSAVFGMLGLDASTEGISTLIASSYPSAAHSISAALEWENVNENTVSWGFYNGNRRGFRSALIAVLSPVMPLLNILLAEAETELFDAIKISGSNGYNTAVIPLLEGLGCSDIRSYSQYKAASNAEEALACIIDPVLGLADALIAAPVSTLCEKLPNIVYFVNSGGIKQCISNLLYPVTVLLQKLGMEDMLPDSLSQLGDIDVAGLLTQLSDGGTLPFKLPAPDLEYIASLGTAEVMDSRRTYNGLFTDYTYIRADAPAVLVTLLRYVIGALSDPANGDGLSSLMGGDMGGNDMFAMYAGNITEQFKTMSVDEIIEWLYNLLFRETPKREIIPEDNYIPTVIYEPEPDRTVIKRALIIAAAVGIPTLLVIYLSKRDVNAKKEKKQRKKLKKQAEKAEKQKNTAAGKAAARKNTAAAATPVKKDTLAAPQNANADMTLRKRENAREMAKLKIRQDRALKKALRDAKKADKYYEQAVKEAGKSR